VISGARLASIQESATNKLQIAALIGDLWRSAEVLTADIEHEERRSGVRNVADPTCPVLARSLRNREVWIVRLGMCRHGDHADQSPKPECASQHAPHPGTCPAVQTSAPW
jgi:hypothetical protein